MFVRVNCLLQDRGGSVTPALRRRQGRALHSGCSLIEKYCGSRSVPTVDSEATVSMGISLHGISLPGATGTVDVLVTQEDAV
jgi:hypothetical protein